ncbi:RNA polymerase sigma-70 factor [Daejeonella lutea]|uniref:RNA polymerase sigma-70 factor, ECF subfamily n=1 Tax=Daejeonella lutea TaxID=572036 RepID=A0A1T5AAW9_9SPHI|nr:RNA polymerase sigma-70 factor [Daejeonella lutea]SKB32076.1 RNA polymerase sigma-70 factor, ECF subfamily [Daejeonella lutea]
MTEMIFIDDTELMDRLRAGDDLALKVIYKKYWSLLYNSAFNMLQDQQACEDIIQELFINLWNKREQIEIKASLKSYLFASVRYEVFRQVRHGSVREDIFENIQDRLQTPSEYGNIEHRELLSYVNSIVNNLSEKCKVVYKLSREEQLSHKEIATKLDISTKTVENHLNKALRQLRISLGLW